MSMKNYGIYQQGAIFYQCDFDPIKVILAVCEKVCKITLPDNIKNALINNQYKAGIAAELCELLGIDEDNFEENDDYSFISDKLVSEAGPNDWFNGPDPLMGTNEIDVIIFTDIEGEYVFDNKIVHDASVDDCYMFSLNFPFVWEIADYTGAKTRGDVVKVIQEAAQVLLKDDIDWDKRLGYLIGSDFA